MVSFNCEACGDVLTKKKLDPHRNRCRGATFSCLDCMVYFPGTEYRAHTSCMTEEQKYQGALYKNKNKKPKLNPTTPEPPLNMAAVIHQPQFHQPQPAYVEDASEEDFEDYLDDDNSDDDDGRSSDGALPHAPTPPPPDEKVDVFDFLVANATPNASNMELGEGDQAKLSDSTQLVRFDYKAHSYLDQAGVTIDDKKQLVQYGTGPIPTPKFQTPAPKGERRRSKDGEKDAKKDKKRKRLHVDVPDQVMTDAPPVLHSGLTGGLNRLMSRPSVFPPSPEYSADAAETPASPLKKTKHSKGTKTSRAETIGNNLVSMLTAKPKTKKRKHVSSVKKHRRSDGDKAPKLIEYRPSSKDKKDGDESQVVFYKPRADLLLSFINKGPDSERGCSMNKVLKRFHRERSASGNSLGKPMEEKELWRSLRLRKNNRGEIVLFCV